LVTPTKADWRDDARGPDPAVAHLFEAGLDVIL
jgi:hypothetical protein